MDQRFHLSPNSGIAFNFGVSLHEDAVVPWVVPALDRVGIVEPEISDDAGACWIGGANLGPAVDKTVRLIEIYRLGYVGGNDRIIFTELGDAIHLDGEQHRNAFFFQFSRQRNRF